MSLVFDHVTLGQRVLFGSGKAAENMAAEVTRLGARNVMMISSGSKAAVTAHVARKISVALDYDDVAPHVPIEKAEKARAVAQEHSIDLLVCVGGGSTI
ncbi:MAG TPA: iron-containing alcohol dehydrogenase, partial [Arthrobacter sp.]|nr:iron-containing alcohol dehydrogenase [Arthrobacter sp.]